MIDSASRQEISEHRTTEHPYIGADRRVLIIDSPLRVKGKNDRHVAQKHNILHIKIGHKSNIGTIS